MKAASVRLASLKTFNDCLEAIESIENDYQNVLGGLKAWNSGRETTLTREAQKKIKAIETKMGTLPCSECGQPLSCCEC